MALVGRVGSGKTSLLNTLPRILDPPGEVKPETEIYALLARRLDFAADALAGLPEGQEVRRAGPLAS